MKFKLFDDFKKFWKYFVFVFLISFLIINWNQVSWIFNYRVVSGIFSDFLNLNEKKNDIQHSKNFLIENAEIKENILEIPKLNISVPVIFSNETDGKKLFKLLDRGVVHFSKSALPGQTGQIQILGHSAPVNWPKIKYDWVFSQLNDLDKGDEIFIFYNRQKYIYKTREKIFLKQRQEVPQFDLDKDKSVLVLISCWPPGKDFKRIAVFSEEKKSIMNLSWPKPNTP